MLPFVRKGIDPFRDRFPVTLRGEGTVRGTGGLRIRGDDCRTGVPGLFAAGDAATRELVAGATSGGGAQNSGWALSSGQWAGSGAAALARAAGRRADEPAIPAGRAGLRPARQAAPVEVAAAIRAVQAEMNPVEKNVFRKGAQLRRSIAWLDGVWGELRDHLAVAGAGRLKAREAAALAATARWCYGAALARAESRGMHRRDDAPDADPRLEARLLVGGFDDVWTRLDADLGGRVAAAQ
jgi:succinate dehydrogenase/fumarate reductase flavoprotein subunit